MENISEAELNYYFGAIKSKVEEKIQHIFERIAMDTDFDKYGLKIDKYEIRKHWGRFGVEFNFSSKSKKDYGQWFFYGIYYDDFDHGIEFKTDDYKPELAFFFDINKDKREELRTRKELKDSLRKLSEKRFEENLIDNKTPNPWRFLFKRTPICEIGEFSYENIKTKFIDIMNQLYEEEGFREEMF